MRRLDLAAAAAVCLAAAAPVQGAPVTTQAALTIQLSLGSGSASFTAHGSGTIDVTGKTVTVPAGLVWLPTTLVVPVTSTTAFGNVPLTARTLSNLSATFSIGGVTAQAPSEVCAGGPGLGEACNAGGGVGGVMALTGQIVWPFGFVAIPIIDFSRDPIGQGGSTNNPFSIDAAAWSTGAGLLRNGTGTRTTVGAGTPLSLVSPTYFDALGNQGSLIATFTLTAVSLPVPEPGLLLLALGVAIGAAALRR